MKKGKEGEENEDRGGGEGWGGNCPWLV